MKERAGKGHIAVPDPPANPTFTLERIFELESYARKCLTLVLEKKQELKEAREIYDGAVEELMNTIRKAHEPEFEFDKKTGEINPGKVTMTIHTGGSTDGGEA